MDNKEFKVVFFKCTNCHYIKDYHYPVKALIATEIRCPNCNRYTFKLDTKKDFFKANHEKNNI